MKTVFHIGPSKTGSTSIQEIIPKLGRPYLIKPEWAKPFCRERVLQKIVVSLKPGTIISDEAIGDFDTWSPFEIAKRLLDTFGSCVVVFVHRDPLERLASMFAHTRRENLDGGRHKTLKDFADWQDRVFDKRKAGFYASSDVDLLCRAFRDHELHTIDFDLLRTDPRAFLFKFCNACGVNAPDITIPHLNRGT